MNRHSCDNTLIRSFLENQMIWAKRLLSIVIMLLFFLIILTGCKEKAPEIITEITLSNLTEEEYSQIGEQSKPEGVSINDLRKLYVNVKIIDSKEAEERIINIPNIFVIIDNFDRVRSTGGGSYGQNNIGTENTAEYTSYAIFDARDLGENEIRSLFGGAEIYIAYKIKNSNLVERNVSIGENMVIND